MLCVCGILELLLEKLLCVWGVYQYAPVDQYYVFFCATVHCIILYSFMKDVGCHLIILINLIMSIEDKNSVTPNAGIKNNT
jgi:hypothetical protein